MNLANQKCISCTKDTPSLKGESLKKLQSQLKPEWKVIDEHHLEREFKFPDFKTALEFTNKVAALAEQEGHHPDILLTWGRVKITMWTHKIDGLSESDFFLAAKCDRLL